MQYMVVRLCTDFKRDELVVGCAWFGFASRDEVGAWSPNSVLDEVRDEQGKDERNEPPEDGDMRLVCTWANDESPRYKDTERYGASVNEQPGFSMGQLPFRYNKQSCTY